VTKNEVESLKWFQKAADAGNSSAQAYLGCCYRDGTSGVTQDYKQAFDLLNKSALQGNIIGMDTVGLAYENGM
jgi:TPR repeat protein